MAIPAPKNLSRWAASTWRQLTADHDFEHHELIGLARALAWWDRSDALLVLADDAAADDRERAGALKAAMDAANTALRHWRVLKWPVPDGVRRPGRPSDANWSAKRKANA